MKSNLKSATPPTFSDVVQDAIQATSIKYNNDVYELKSAGVDVTVLSLGEAFFDIPLLPMEVLPTPQIFHYTHSRGLLELRQKLCSYYEGNYCVEVNPDREIVITAGSKAAIYFAMMSVLNPGDEVIIHEPSWVSYPEQVKLCYGKPVMMPHSCSIRDYERYITNRSKLIVINNPHNPRGQVFGRNELEYLVAMAKANGLYVLADEAYSDFVLGNDFYSLGVFDAHKSNIIICNSISKNFGISGWRLGYVIANATLMDQILKINQHIVTCPPSILQYYMAYYFDNIIEITSPQIKKVIQKRTDVAKILDDEGIKYQAGSATFYLFVSIAPSKLSSEVFCERLLNEDHVCVVPGKGYGDSCDSFVRLSVGSESLERIALGISKLKRLIEKTT